MYIKATGITSGSEIAKKKSAKKSAGGFSDVLSSSETEESQAAGATSISSTSQLFFMQEIDDDESQKKQSVSQGFDALKYLDNIRAGLLTGALSKDTIVGLDSLLQKMKKNFVDPQLSNIIDEIELRAKVEIAKLDRN